MPKLSNTVAPVAPAAAAPVAAAKPGKRGKPAAASVKPEPVAPVAALPAAPIPAKPEPVADTDQRHAERIAATAAIAGFYSGRSLPFKAASDTFAAFRTDKAPKAATERQAALLAAMLLSGDNIKPDGTFQRGGFIHDGRNVQPETGCLSDMHGRTVTHVSGPLAGKQARDATFRVDLAKARAEIGSLIGDKLGKLAIAKIDKLLAA